MPYERASDKGSREMTQLVPAVLIALLATTGCANTYYVDTAQPAAADTNSGTQAAPFKTLSHAASQLKPGDTLIVRPGVYDELVTVAASGTRNAPITLKSATARKARVKGFKVTGDYITIEGFEIANDAERANGVDCGQTHMKTARKGCRILNNLIHDVDGKAITSGELALVKGNVMRNVGWGLFVNSGTLVEDNEIDGLVFKMIEKKGKIRPRTTKYAFFAGDDITFRGNYFHGAPAEHLKSMGVCFFGTWDAWIFGPSHRILIENNRCFNGTHASEPIGEVHKKSSHITYRNNLFVNTVYVGVLCKGWSNITVEHNTFINCGAYPVWFQSKRETEGSVVRNNLIAYWKHDRNLRVHDGKPAESGIRNTPSDDPTATIDCDYNMFWGCKNRKYGKHDFVAEPQFVDPDKGDFRLKPGSPGVDAGIDIGITIDLTGTKRPQGSAPDVGAYELKETSK